MSSDHILTLVEIAALAWLLFEVRSLKKEMNIMTEASEQLRQDIAAIKSKIAGIADAYTNAAAARLQKALDSQKAAIEAQSRADLDAAHQDAQSVIDALTANQPITPPATPADPSPAPVASPADPAAVETAAGPAA